MALINVNQSSPRESALDRWAKIAGIAQNVATIGAHGVSAIGSLKEQSLKNEALERDKKLAEEEANPDSAISLFMNSTAEKVGIVVPAGTSAAQYKRVPGLYEYVLARAKEVGTQENEERKIRLKGEEDRKTKSMEISINKQKEQRLPADKVLQLNEGKQMPGLLDKIETTIKNNEDSFGPIIGTAGGLNPYNETSQTIQSQMKSSAQLIGKYMEGGVLRKEDVAKYEAMLPKLSDTPQVAYNKLQIVRKMLADKSKSDIEAVGASGYNVAGVPAQESNAELPQVLKTGKQSKSIIPQANAAETGKPAPAAGPGATVLIKGKMYRVEKDGDTLTPL